MDHFYRVFGSNEVAPDPEILLARLRREAPAVQVRFAGAGANWFQVEIVVGSDPPLVLERYLAEEEGIRAELNTWAGILETCEDSPQHVPLMERVIGTRQLFTLGRPADHPDGNEAERVCVVLCRILAELTEGFYQADEQGFFAADGTLLVREANDAP
jgi:hypothetical protein